MITIRRVQRKTKVEEDRWGREWEGYSETEAQYMERVATLCSSFKEIISIQFFVVNERIDNCIITYKANN
jgi:hypothetical protein